MNKVETDKGFISLAQIIKEKLPVKVKDDSNKFVEIEEYHLNGEQEIWEFEDEEGVIYECTPDHPFMVIINENLVEKSIKEIYLSEFKILKQLGLGVREVSIVRGQSLRSTEVGDISIKSESRVYQLNGGTLVHNCKESNLAHNFTVMRFDEKTGVLLLKYEGHEREVPSKIKVKFWDHENEIMIIGPLEVAIHKNFAIDKEVLLKVVTGDLTRVLAD